MHNITLNIIVISSILWGVGYPDIFRVPLYILVITIATIITFVKRIKYFKNVISNLRNFEFFNSNKKKVAFILICFLILIYVFIWRTFSIFYCLSIISFVLSGNYFLDSEKSTNKNWFYYSLVISLSLVAISVPFVGPFNQYVSASPSIYPEPSNLGFTLGPVLGILTLKRGYRISGVLGIMFFHYFCFSRSLWIGYLCSLLISKKYQIKINPTIFAFVIFFVIVLLVCAMYLVSARIENVSDIKDEFFNYPSIVVWYIWLKYSLVNLSQHPLGLGPFGWIDVINNSDFVSLCENKFICIINGTPFTTLNIRDLASLTSFGFASFGILFPVFLFSFLNYLCNFNIISSEMYFELNPISALIISYVFTYLFRWTGLTAGPLLGLLFLLGALHGKNKLCLTENEIH